MNSSLIEESCGFLERTTVSSSSIEERSKRERNWGASILVDEKDTIEEKPQREEEPHKRVIVVVAIIVYCRERMHWGALMLRSPSSI